MVVKTVVTVKEGKVCGIKTRSSFSGVEFYSFYGIPYGQPTSNNARFKDPVKVKPWKNVYDATKEKEGCIQFSPRLEKFCGTEDCLYTNIHTPKLPFKGEPLKSVIVNIHPGGYTHGSPETWYYGSPDYVMHRDIVYVSVAYRLHMLGFLNLGLEECSGNQGLKDIILSLKWIKENITAFCGDPDNVTLIGSSSGSSIVHFLMFSPAAKGLFHKAVVMGIYVFNPVLVLRKDNQTIAYEFARNVGYEGTDPKDSKRLLSFFKKLKMEDLIMTLRPATMGEFVHLFPCSPFLPSVDHGNNAVLPKPFRELMAETARIPLMFGICDKEGAMAFAKPLKKRTMENFFTSYTQNYYGWASNIDPKEVDIIGEKIRSFYLNGASIQTASMDSKIDILTDAAYSDVYDTLINLVAAELPSSVFVYKFEFEGNVCTMKDRLANILDEPLKGTCHAADFSYWAVIKDHWGVKTATLNSKSAEFVEIFTKLISTFAKTGDPNYQGLNVLWKPSTPENPCYLCINDPLQMVDGKLSGKRMEFWEGLKREFQKIEIHYDTCALTDQLICTSPRE